MLKSFIRFRRPLVVLLGFFLLFWLFYLLRAILVPFIIGFIFAYILAPVVQILENRQIPRSVAIIISYVFFLGLIALFIFYAVPLLLKDLNQLASLIPRYVQSLQEALWQMQDGYSRVALPEGVRQVIDGAITRVEQMSLGFVQGFIHGLIGLLGQSFNLILAPIISYYFLRDFDHLEDHLLKAVPLRYRHEVMQVGKDINRVLRGFIKGSLLVAFWVGLLTTLGMYIIGMDFSVLIGIMVGVTNIIPYFGAIISAVPAILLALLKSKWLALYVLGLMVLVHQLESNIISPHVLGSSVGLHPLIIIFALLAGGRLWGFGGLLLAVPLAAILKVIVKHLYLRLV
ncbi:MAG TPA: AI-2E family transporter [Clostridia bacterium]|jgi:predicted PurR-regulated permease PerM|nr:AI-2E family transporter [Clostridia bacterium]HHY06769.1 AI-2E family transporter [Clostridia bacterium]